MISTDGLLERFLANDFEQIFCEKCMNTFLTNVYDAGDYVILEKYALGLEYYRDAIATKQIHSAPDFSYLGALDSMTSKPLANQTVPLFTHDEPNVRLLYIMEKLKHLPAEDEAFFTEHVHGMDWLDDTKRRQIIDWVAEKYNPTLAQDIRKLCQYHREHKDYIDWDLHGDNLMLRPATHEIVILDPYTLNSLDHTHGYIEPDFS